ncbi:hypothetical protein AOLI_G00253730 [Acnodon oligacanthus]
MRKTLLMMGTSTARPAVSCLLMSATFMVLHCLRMIPPRPWELLRGLSSLFLKAWSSVDQLLLERDSGFLTRAKLFLLECILDPLMER